jgi:hypothetical protein
MSFADYYFKQIIYASPAEAIILPDETQSYGWVYVGSANLSESAW